MEEDVEGMDLNELARRLLKQRMNELRRRLLNVTGRNKKKRMIIAQMDERGGG